MDLLNVKLLLITAIHTFLFSILIRYKYLKNFNFVSLKLLRFLVNISFFLTFFLLNKFLYSYDKYTLYIINAASLTIIYVELAFYLEKHFWRDFLQNELPFSINLLLSFVLMINAGYFTLMFILRILQAEKFY